MQAALRSSGAASTSAPRSVASVGHGFGAVRCRSNRRDRQATEPERLEVVTPIVIAPPSKGNQYSSEQRSSGWGGFGGAGRDGGGGSGRTWNTSFGGGGASGGSGGRRNMLRTMRSLALYCVWTFCVYILVNSVAAISMVVVRSLWMLLQSFQSNQLAAVFAGHRPVSAAVDNSSVSSRNKSSSSSGSVGLAPGSAAVVDATVMRNANVMDGGDSSASGQPVVQASDASGASVAAGSLLSTLFRKSSVPTLEVSQLTAHSGDAAPADSVSQRYGATGNAVGDAASSMAGGSAVIEDASSRTAAGGSQTLSGLFPPKWSSEEEQKLHSRAAVAFPTVGLYVMILGCVGYFMLQ